MIRALRIAVVDGSSSVLPYDFQLVQALAARGVAVEFHGSPTRYNGELLEAMRALAGVAVVARPISGTVTSRARGVARYAALWWRLVRTRSRFDAIDLQFSILWPLELPFLWVLRRRLVYTVHNAVPHGHAGLRHAPTGWIAAMARTLVFISPSTRDDFLRRYGERFRARAVLAPHGTTPAHPGGPLVPYRPLPAPEALVYWSTVKPYKGVELFAELARSAAFLGLGLPLEIHGAWASELHGLRDELAGLGVRVVDRYLDAGELAALLARPVVFLMPNREATQSGALYTLLHHGRPWICTDVGDLGAFMRRHGLQALLMQERSADAVIACLAALREQADALAAAFARAQAASGWAEAADATIAALRDPP